MKESILKQDLKEEIKLGGIFIIHLLMEEEIEIPEKALFIRVMQKHLGNIECFSYSNSVAGFSSNQYKVHFEKEDIKAPVQLMITCCNKIEEEIMDDVAKTQLWNCEKGLEILEQCPYQVVATDVLASGLEYKERAVMLVKYVEALVELYPSCKAVVFENSKKMLAREEILNCNLSIEYKFIYYAVNVRFFNIHDTNDMLVDSLGMSTLFLPDIQCHFHSMNPNDIVNYAYDILYYIYDNNNPIKDGNTIVGLSNGVMNTEIMWKLQYESSLIQPLREVVDINTLEFAAGIRN